MTISMISRRTAESSLRAALLCPLPDFEDLPEDTPLRRDAADRLPEARDPEEFLADELLFPEEFFDELFFPAPDLDEDVDFFLPVELPAIITSMFPTPHLLC